MANKRIKDLSTTAAVTASDDFIAVDGATNGTRKLDAYNPTFGGNLTVSGTSALNGTVNTNGAKAVNVTPTMTPLSGNLYGLYVQPTINSGASAGGTVSGLTVAATNSGTSNVTNIAGIEFIGGNGAVSGSMQDLKAFRSSPVNLSTGQIANLYQFYATNAYNPSGTINTQYGLYVDALTSATTNYAIYTAGTAPSVLGGNLTVSGGTVDVGTGKIKFTNASQILTGFTAPYVWKVYDNSAGRDILNFNQTANTLLTGCTFLVGSGATPSGNGAIQLATHTTSAGGIGFGTDVSVYRVAAGALRVDNTGAGDAQISVARAGVVNSTWYVDGSNVYLDAQRPSMGFVFRTNGSTTALTLDSSQNATFAGKVAVSGAAANYALNAVGFVESQGTTNSKGFRIYNTATGEAVNFQSNGITQTYDGTFDIASANTTGLRIYGNAGSPLWRWVPWNGGSAGIVTNDSSGYINTSKSLPLLPITAPAAPASGWLLYTDSADSNKLKAKASTGTVVTLGTP